MLWNEALNAVLTVAVCMKSNISTLENSREFGLPATVEMTDSSTTSDIQSQLTEKSTVTNEENVDYKRKYETLLEKTTRKEDKRRKKIQMNTVRKKVKDIPKDKQLGMTQKYQLRTLTKHFIWKCMKFWHVELEKKAVHKALKHLEIKSEEDIERVRDHVSAYMEESIIMKRNNTIGAIKKLVCGSGQDRSK